MGRGGGEEEKKRGDVRSSAGTLGDCDVERERERGGGRRAGGYWIAPVSFRNDFSMTPGM